MLEDRGIEAEAAEAPATWVVVAASGVLLALFGGLCAFLGALAPPILAPVVNLWLLWVLVGAALFFFGMTEWSPNVGY